MSSVILKELTSLVNVNEQRVLYSDVGQTKLDLILARPHPERGRGGDVIGDVVGLGLDLGGGHGGERHRDPPPAGVRGLLVDQVAFLKGNDCFFSVQQ